MFGAIEGMLSRQDEAATTVTVHRLTQTSGQGGHPNQTPATVATALRMQIQKLSGGEAERAFGQQSKARYKGALAVGANIQVNDVVVPDSGPYAGNTLKVEDELQRGAHLLILAMKKTKQAVI